MALQGDDSHKKQTPHQDLPDEGSALTSVSTKHEVVGALEPQQMDSMATVRASKARPKAETTHEEDPSVLLKLVDQKASLLVSDSSVAPDDRLVHLRLNDSVRALKLTDVDLQRKLIQAQARLDGRPVLKQPGEKLSTKPIKWLVEDLLIKDGTNLVFAEPKAGKSRFLLGALGALLNGSDKYLDKQLFYKGEKLLICGPDMTESSWASFLKDYELADEAGMPHPSISGITCAGMNFRLDQNGIDLVEQQARENPGLIILVDSLATCMWGLGMDENKSTAADPLMQLMQAVAQFKTTLIVIHHAKKGSGEGGVSASARGSSAIAAVFDQIISLRVDRKIGTDEETGEIALQTRGRASKPMALSIRQGDDGKTWESLGSPEDRQAARLISQKGEKLTSKQRQVMLVLCQQFKTDKKPLTITDICRALSLDHKSHRVHVRNYLDGLINAKGFVKTAGELKLGPAKPATLYLPTNEGREWYDKEICADSDL